MGGVAPGVAVVAGCDEAAATAAVSLFGAGVSPARRAARPFSPPPDPDMRVRAPAASRRLCAAANRRPRPNRPPPRPQSHPPTALPPALADAAARAVDWAAAHRDPVAAAATAAGAYALVKAFDVIAARGWLDRVRGTSAGAGGGRGASPRLARSPSPFPPPFQTVTRKLVHTLAGPGYVLCWPLFRCGGGGGGRWGRERWRRARARASLPPPPSSQRRARGALLCDGRARAQRAAVRDEEREGGGRDCGRRPRAHPPSPPALQPDPCRHRPRPP